MASVEEIVKHLEKAPRLVPGFNWAERFASIPTEFIIQNIFQSYKNYRAHSKSSIDDLARSIKERGLLEPLLLVFNENEKKWYFLDGEGRFWACMKLGAKEVPVIIRYNVNQADRLGMQIAANSTKSKIDAEDLSIFSKRLYQALLIYDPESGKSLESVLKNGKDLKNITLEEFSTIIGRHASSVRRYLIFANMDGKVVDYVLKHRDETLFSRAVKIGEKIKDHEDQRDFFFNVLKYIENNQNRRIDQHEFNEKLNRRAEDLRKKGFDMETQNGIIRVGDKKIRMLFEKINTARNYVSAFLNLINYFPEIKSQLLNYDFEKVNTLGFTKKDNFSPYGHSVSVYIDYLTGIYCCEIASMLEKTKEKLEQIIKKENAPSLKDKILKRSAEQNKKGMSGGGKIMAIGSSVKYIPVENIELNPDQPRSYYKPESIERLVSDIKKYGQVKPGLGRETGENRYQLIFGQSRYQAVVRAGKPFYKMFVNNNLTDVEIAILQCMEDLSEEDKPPERARVIFQYYQLVQQQKNAIGKEYSAEDFARDYSHLASRETITNALAFMGSDEIIQSLAYAKLIGYDAAIKLNKLKPKERIDIIYSVMCSDLSSKEIENRIMDTVNMRNQQNMFSNSGIHIPQSFAKIFKQLEIKTRSAFESLFESSGDSLSIEDLGKVQKRVRENANLNYLFQNLYKSIEKLEYILENGKPF